MHVGGHAEIGYRMRRVGNLFPLGGPHEVGLAVSGRLPGFQDPGCRWMLKRF
jgi:hypothetical protein